MKYAVYMIGMLVLFLWACENNIEGPEDIEKPNDNNMKATFTSIQNELFNKSCALSGCHGGNQQPDLRTGQSFNNLVNVQSAQNPSLMRVKPFESENSWLIKKLKGEGTSVMPPSGKLSTAVIDSVIAWIDNGAQNN